MLKKDKNIDGDILGFGEIDNEKLGEIVYRGDDGQGRRIYTIATKGSGGIVKRALTGFSEVYHLEPLEFIDTNRYNSIYISIGMLISRKISQNLGNKIILWGIRKDFSKLMTDVRQFTDSKVAP